MDKIVLMRYVSYFSIKFSFKLIAMILIYWLSNLCLEAPKNDRSSLTWLARSSVSSPRYWSVMFDVQSDPLLTPFLFLEWIYTCVQQMPCQVLGPVPGTQPYEGDSGPGPSPHRLFFYPEETRPNTTSECQCEFNFLWTNFFLLFFRLQQPGFI